MRLTFVLILLCALLPQSVSARDLAEVTLPAPPGPDTDLAKQHYEAGQQAFEQKRYEAAAVEFRAGYELSHEPEFLFNLSVVREKQGRIEEAIDLEEQFIRAKAGSILKPGESKADIEKEGQDRLSHLRGLLQPKQISAFDQLQGSSAKSSTSGFKPPAGAITLFAVGGAGILAAVGCSIGALAANSQINGGGPFFPNEYSELVARGNALDRATIGLGVIGGTAVAVATVWTLVYRFKK